MSSPTMSGGKEIIDIKPSTAALYDVQPGSTCIQPRGQLGAPKGKHPIPLTYLLTYQVPVQRGVALTGRNTTGLLRAAP